MRTQRKLYPLLAFTLSGARLAFSALPSMISFQGQIKEAGAPVNDSCDFSFTLWDDPISKDAAHTIGQPVSLTDVSVVNGLFTVPLDFGLDAFNGEQRWLGVSVRCPAGSGTFALLSPRHGVLPTPYSLRAVQGVGGATGLNVSPAGDVGIATQAPEAKLHVAGTPGVDGIMFPDGSLQTTALLPSIAPLNIQAKVSQGTDVGTSWGDIIGLSVTIIPSSPSSSFLVFASAGAGCKVQGCGSQQEWALRVARVGPNGAEVLQTLISDEGGAEGRSAMHPMTFTLLDRPSTTSPITYKVQARAVDAGVFRVPGLAGSMGEQSDAILLVTETRGGTTQQLAPACCFPNNFCLDLLKHRCEQAGGEPQGAGSSCDAGDCEPRRCEFPDGLCEDLTPFECRERGGTPQNPGTVCPHACCVPGIGCVNLTTSECLEAGGLPSYPGQLCTPHHCGILFFRGEGR